MPPRRKPLPNPLPNGYILTDTEKKQWKLGEIIGQGGFGLIYLAQTAAHIIGKNYEIDNYLLNGINSLKSSVGIIIAFGYTASRRLDAPVPSDSDFVIKVEYHENGPLFSELKFYQRAAKPESIQRWKKRHGLDFLGIPSYFGSGLAEYNGTRYRFMVMDRLGKDLQKVCAENGGRLKRPTVLKLGCLLLDMLEFIHENEYVHADIKAANLLLGHRDPSKVYLADYGLSYRYCPEGVHKEYKENPKKGHNGTIEYTSTDAHNGVAPSRRGDLEVLGYCLLHWLCGKLPWDSMLKRPVMVQEAKAKLMANLPDSIMELSPSGTSTGEVAKFLLCVKSLGYKERPNYLKLRNILSEGLSKTAWKEGLLDLSGPREEARGPTPRCKPMKVKPTAVEAPRPRPLPQEDSGFAAKADLPGCPPVHQRRPKMQPRLSHPQDEKKRQAQPKQMVRRVEVYDDDESDNEPNSENQGSPHHPYSLRERPPSKQDTSWGLKHWGGVITILFFLIFVILLVLEPQIPWSRKVEVL